MAETRQGSQFLCGFRLVLDGMVRSLLMKKTKVSTMNFSLPRSLREQLDKKVQRLGAYGSTNEYLRELVRRDLKRDAVAHVDELLLEGLASGPSEPVNDAWREARRAELARHRRERAKKHRKSA